MQRQELEKIFSSNHGSAIFPVLANLYYKEQLYRYAIKVCELGLNEDPNNLEGQYIFAKSLLIQGQTQKAEKVLCDIINHCPYHLYSNLLLIQAYEELGRNKKTIENQIKSVYSMYHHHPVINEYFNSYCRRERTDKRIVKSIKPKKNISTNSFSYNSKLATITMYKLLKNQNEYEYALDVLNILADNPKHAGYAKKEIKEIKIKLRSL